jgi:hypothetical protein
MAKAPQRTTPPPAPADKPTRYIPSDWIRMGLVFARMAEEAGLTAHVDADLHNKLRSGLWPSARRHVADDGSETFTHNEPVFWNDIRLNMGCVHTVQGAPTETFARWRDCTFYVHRLEFEKLYPPGASPRVAVVGRPPTVDADAVKAEKTRRLAAGEKVSHGVLAQHFGVSKQTIGRRLKEK